VRRRNPCIVAAGDLAADLVVELPRLPVRAEDFQLAGAISLEPGGNANLLIALSRLGAECVALGVLGEDPWGVEVARILEEEAVDLSLVRRQRDSTLALVLVDDSGRHALVGRYGEGASEVLGREQRRRIAAADAVFASGHSLREERARKLTLQSLEEARHSGVPCFFDPGPVFADLDREVKEKALSLSDVLLLNGGESEGLIRSSGGPDTVVVKRGAAGCRLHVRDERPIEVQGPAVSVRDTTGAGDCFDAGYIFAYLRGRSPVECARLANLLGAAAVQKVGGGRNVPTRAELLELIAADGTGVEL